MFECSKSRLDDGTVLGIVLGDSDRLDYMSWSVGERSLNPMRSRTVGVGKGDREVRMAGLGEQSGDETEFVEAPLARVGDNEADEFWGGDDH